MRHVECTKSSNIIPVAYLQQVLNIPRAKRQTTYIYPYPKLFKHCFHTINNFILKYNELKNQVNLEG